MVWQQNPTVMSQPPNLKNKNGINVCVKHKKQVVRVRQQSTMSASGVFLSFYLSVCKQHHVWHQERLPPQLQVNRLNSEQIQVSCTG